MQKIDLNNWKRKEHYGFFSKMDSPYFGLITEVDCTICFEEAKRTNTSFFARYLHKSLLAANSVEELRYRIIDNDVYLLDKVNAGSTIARKDGTFGLSYIHFNEDFDSFNQELQQEIEAVQNGTGLRLNNEDQKKDLVRHSSVPWTSFTGLLHPTSFNNNESVPKIVFGKFYEKNGKKMLPISIEAHHGLADGLHLSLYLKELQRLMDLTI